MQEIPTEHQPIPPQKPPEMTPPTDQPPQKPPLSLHWGLVLGTGILVAILVVILEIVLIRLISLVWGQPDQYLIDRQVTLLGTYAVEFLLTFWGGVWIARKVERNAPLHGFLVGLAAALILDLLCSSSFDLVTVLFFVLTVAAGLLGGVWGSRRRKQS